MTARCICEGRGITCRWMGTAMGVSDERYTVDLAMVRGLGYYTGPIFETIVEEPKIGSLTGGGRYDELIGLFTKRSLPVTGTTLGIERLIDVIEELHMFPPSLGRTTAQVFVTVFEEATRSESVRLSSELRKAGFNVETSYSEGKLGKQIRYASEKGIPFVVVLGPDEGESFCGSRPLSPSSGITAATIRSWLWEVKPRGCWAAPRAISWPSGP